MNYNTLLDNNYNIFTVYNFDNKFRCGDALDGGYILGDLDTQYDCYISAGLASCDNFSIGFLDKYNINISDCYGFDGTIENMPLNLINKMQFIKKNIGFKNDSKTSNLTDIIEKYSNIFLKMDIEGGEWQWLLSMNENILDKFGQIVIELHGITNTSWHAGLTMHKFCSYSEKIASLEKLQKTHYIIHAHGNNADRTASNGLPNVIELTYVNKRFFNSVPMLNSKPLPSHLDYANDISHKDVDLNFAPFVNKL